MYGEVAQLLKCWAVNHDNMVRIRLKHYFIVFSVAMPQRFVNVEQRMFTRYSCSKRAFNKRLMLLIFKLCCYSRNHFLIRS